MSIYEQITGAGQDFVDWRERGGFTPQLHGILGEIGEAAGYFLSPRGRQAAMNVIKVGDMLNPVSAALRSGQQFSEGDYVGAMTEVAGILIPTAIVYKYGTQTALAAAKAIQETLTGTGNSMNHIGSDVYEKFIARMNQPGPAPNALGSNFGNVGRASPHQSGPAPSLDVAPNSGRRAPNKSKTPDLDQAPTVNLRDLEGAVVVPTVADLMRTGQYTGIDASKVDVPEPLFGGPGYPLLGSSRDNNLIWATEGEHIVNRKLGRDPDLIAVTAMTPRSHKGNISFHNSVIKTIHAYARDGRITKNGMDQLDALIRAGSGNAKNSVKGLETFPGFQSADLDEWMSKSSFKQRAKIADILSTKEAMSSGGPNITRILEETVDPRYSGSLSGDTLMFLRPDGRVVDLTASKLPTHPSYRYGILGNLEGAPERPISTFNLFEDHWKKLGIDNRNAAYHGGKRRQFDMKLPPHKITGDQISRLEELMQMEAALGKRLSGTDARVLKNSVVSAWKTTLDAVNKGGVSPQGFADAIANSKYKPALTNYTEAEIKAGAKNGTFEAFQLGDDELFFGLDKAPDYSWVGVEMRPGDKSLVGVVSNVPGMKGQAVPAVMAKAIEEGVTMLDAFAVPSARFPNGFLTDYYSDFGFVEAGRIPFSKEFYVADHGEQAYKDLIDAWKTDGWDESLGFPDLVVMRWDGKDADRANIAAGIRTASAQGIRPKTSQLVSEARGTAGHASGQASGPGKASDRRPVRRADGDSGTSSAERTGSSQQSIFNLSDEVLKNKGLSADDIAEIRKTPQGILGSF